MRARMIHLGGALALCSALSTSAIAATGTTPGNYIWYKFPSSVTAITDITYNITVNQDPGPLANVFWSNQFDLAANTTNPTKLTGYMGMQVNGGNKRTFLISIWGATASKAGDPGTTCQTGTEGTPFVNCHLISSVGQPFYWQQGHAYQFHIVNEGNQWFGATVTDVTTNTSIKLGSIQTGRDAIDPKGNTVSWTEFFEWNSSLSTCNDQPYVNATFGVPVVYNNGTLLSASISSKNNGNSCAYDTSSIAAPAGPVIVTNATHNSLRGPIINAQGQCLINTNGMPSLGACNAFDGKQGWVMGANGAVQNNHLCLSNTSGLPVNSCTGNTSQLWTYQNGQLKQQGTNFCLTNTASVLSTQTCSTWATSQQWTLPGFPGTPTMWNCANATPINRPYLLKVGTTLCPLDTMTSPHGKYHLNVQQDGNLAIYDANNALQWTSGTNASNPIRATLQKDGNFVIYDGTNAQIWSTGITNSPSGSWVFMQDDGNLVDYGVTVAYASNSGDPSVAASNTAPYMIKRGTSLSAGQSVTSGNGKFSLSMQTSGNLVVTRNSDGQTIFSTGTSGAGNYATMQTDGNFVVYSSGGAALWATHTSGTAGALLFMQNDGNLVLYSLIPKWSRF